MGETEIIRRSNPADEHARGAKSTTTKRGDHKGQKTTRFYNRNQETARTHPCCWGHHNNCNRTRIGMYLKALDENIYSNSSRTAANKYQNSIKHHTQSNKKPNKTTKKPRKNTHHTRHKVRGEGFEPSEA